MSNKDILDVVVVVALEEEFNVLKTHSDFKFTKGRTLGIFRTLSYTFFDREHRKRTGMIVLVNDMSSAVRDAVAWLGKLEPALVVNIGISGGLDKDVRVGDVVVPTHIDLYAEHAAAVDSQDSFQIKSGGPAYSIEKQIISVLTEAHFSNECDINSLSEYVINNSNIALTSQEKVVIKDKEEKCIVSTCPKIVSGKFACGSFVGKSTYFKRYLKDKDRKYIAMDMESGYARGALESFPRDKRPEFISIRAISDDGDMNKSDSDQFKDGLLRTWAMSNAVSVLDTFLKKGFVFEPNAKDIESAQNIGDRSAHYVENHPGKIVTENVVDESVNKRLSNLRRLEEITNTSETITFVEFLSEILTSENGSKFLVDGTGGSGKSYMLRLADIRINSSDTTTVSKYLNIQKIIDELPKDQLEDHTRKLLESEIALSEIQEREIVVFVDELFGKSTEKPIIDSLVDILRTKRGKIVLAYGFDHFETSLQTDDRNPYIYKYKFTSEYRLKNTTLRDDEKALPIVQGLIETTDGKYSTDPATVLSRIHEIGFPYLNSFVVSLVIENFDKRLFRECSNSTEFVLHAMDGEFQEILKLEGLSFSFMDVCIEALRTHVPEFRQQKHISIERYKVTEFYDRHFAKFPKLVQACLVANAVVTLLSDPPSKNSQCFEQYEIPADKILGIVFAVDVTSCVKDLMMDEILEERLLSSALDICSTHDATKLTFSLYLAGRANTTKGKEISKLVFESTNAALLADVNIQPDPRTTDISEITRPEKFRRLAKRTHYISQAYANNRASTDEYISRILEDPIEESLNRSFHLEYYGDTHANYYTSRILSVRLDLKDTCGPWKRTKGILQDRIHSAILKSEFSQLDRIHTLTLFCVVRSRQEANNLSVEEKSDFLSLTKQLGKFSGQLGEQIWHYILMVEYCIENNISDFEDVICVLYSLKAETRFGWVARNFGEKADIESVAAHVTGAMLLADAYIPIIFPKMSQTEKAQIQDLILTHDVGESIVGDFHPNNQEKKLREKRAVGILYSLSTFEWGSGLNRYKSRYREFTEGSTKAGTIAYDFDKLDAIFQAYIYRNRFSSKEDVFNFINDNSDRIKNIEVKNIAQRILDKYSNWDSDASIGDESTKQNIYRQQPLGLPDS